MKWENTLSNGIVCAFLVDYIEIENEDIPNKNKYLMEKNNAKECLNLLNSSELRYNVLVDH